MIVTPLVLRFKDMLVGDGFLAYVDAKGRAMLTRDYNSHWVYGVYPGALAASGSYKK